MQRIIEVKRPFQKSVEFGESASLSVIQQQDGNGEADSELQYAVNFIQCKEVDKGINKNPKYHQKHLLCKLALEIGRASCRERV